ncbi:MAG: catabolite repressor protein, partial [Cypionkella sp.]|nr:catabolite repressor protein [Cypionkella sp.]
MALILPHHDNKYFSSLSESFAREARNRGLCPVIVATHRDPAEESATVRDLLSYAIDQLFIVAAHDPDAISQICHDAQLRHVFIDHPSRHAPSVITDNREGARGLSNLILASMPLPPGTGLAGVYFLGGDADQFATGDRIEGFREAMRQSSQPWDENQIIPSTYDPGKTRESLVTLHATLGGLPSGLLVNSITCFEGVLDFLGGLPEDEINRCVFGCYDYDPLAALLRFPVHMVRQRHRALIQTAY